MILFEFSYLELRPCLSLSQNELTFIVDSNFEILFSLLQMEAMEFEDLDFVFLIIVSVMSKDWLGNTTWNESELGQVLGIVEIEEFTYFLIVNVEAS